MVKIEISGCYECPYGVEHQIISPDSFSSEFGVYCTKVPDSSDSWERRTTRGIVNYRLAHYRSDVWAPRTTSGPPWCPFLIEKYGQILTHLKGLRPISGGDANIIKTAHQIITTLEKARFDGFVYQKDSAERDRCLVEIALLCMNCYTSSKQALSALDLQEKDAAILEVVMKEIPSIQGARSLVNQFTQVKEAARGTIAKAVLGSELTVPATLYLAEAIVQASCWLKDARLVFVGQGKDGDDYPRSVREAELHYVTMNPSWRDDIIRTFIDGTEKSIIDLIVKEFLGVKELRYFIDDQQIG